MALPATPHGPGPALESRGLRGRSSVGRALASQAKGRGFEARRPLSRVHSLHPQAAPRKVVPSGDATAHSVLANVAAIEAADEFAHSSEPFSVDRLKRIHARLFQSTPQDHWGGVVRDRQNWIGGDATTPVNAAFVPPPEGEVPRLLEDLATFCNRIDLPPVLQAAVAHAQYETIHPFMDGNGRAGRALIGMILIRRGVANDVLPPISLILAGDSDAYVRGLTSYRYTSGSDWVDFFSGAMIRAADSAELLARGVGELAERWLEAAGSPRAWSAPRRLIEALPTHSVLTLATAQSITGLRDEACRRALNRLEESGVLHQTTAGKRNRVWESVGLFDLLDRLEREVGGRAAGARAHQLTAEGVAVASPGN